MQWSIVSEKIHVQECINKIIEGKRKKEKQKELNCQFISKLLFIDEKTKNKPLDRSKKHYDIENVIIQIEIAQKYELELEKSMSRSRA